MTKRLLAVLAATSLASGVAYAEVIQITGEFAAPNREASLLRSISVDRFGGQDGPALGIAIERGLGNGPFELLGGRAGRDIAEGSISGAVSTGVDESGFKRNDKRCTEKNDKGKCVKEEAFEVGCRRRIVNVNADIRIVRNTDGRILYSAAKPFREEVSWCGGERPTRTAEDTISAAIGDIANSVRGDIVPRVETYRIRVRESDKGLSKEQAGRFKELVKLTKRDAAGACAGWNAMLPEAPGHASLLFNLGLCAEQSGDYARALALYGDAVRAGAREGADGADRATRLIAGREDAARRARR